MSVLPKASKKKLNEQFSTTVTYPWLKPRGLYRIVPIDSSETKQVSSLRTPRKLNYLARGRVNDTKMRFPLHVFNPGENGYRRPYGGTCSQGFKGGAIVKNKKYGVCYVGGEDIKKLRISLHDIHTGKRLTQSAKPSETKHLCFNSWRLTAVKTA